MKAVIVLPTYNEKQNIKKLIPLLLEEFRKIKHDMHILVVDDKSPDGTADEVRKFQQKHKNIHLLLGEKNGLGAAYIRGFDHAAHHLKADVMLEMDADLQHPPDLIPHFMRAIDEGYDFVIGSRYIPGGGTPGFPITRQIISRGGNFFARFVAGLYKVNDCTSGYRALRTSIYKKIKKEDLETKGYAFQSTVLYEFLRHGARVKEIPLVFRLRQHGESKISRKDMQEFFMNSVRLRMKSSEKLIKFSLVGGTGIFINMLFLWLLTEHAKIKYLYSSPIAVELSILWNFFLNNLWTFREVKGGSFMGKLAKFHIAAAGGFAINYLILLLLVEKFNMYYLAANLVGILVAFVWNYIINVMWTWRVAEKAV